MDTVEVKSGPHTFVLRRTGVGAEMRVRRILGAEVSKDETYVSLATLAYAVETIDGVPVLKPKSAEDFEAIQDRFDGAIKDLANAFAKLNGGDGGIEAGVVEAKN